MTGASDGDGNGRAGQGVAGQLISFVVFVAAVLLGTTTFLSFLGTECAQGRPHLTPVFVCFPGR
jgi:hypothetical protein